MTYAFLFIVLAYLVMTFGREVEDYLKGYLNRHGKKRNFKRYTYKNHNVKY